MSTAINILLVEDQTMVLDALSKLLGMELDINVAATASDGQQALDLLTAAEEGSIDVLVTDIEMPNMDGLTLCAHMQTRFAAIKTLIMTTYNRSGYVKRALDEGVDGFILKESPVEELAEAIRDLMAGKRYYDPELIVSGLQDNNPLTSREVQVLKLVAEGLDNKMIAENLSLSAGTVRNYLSEAMNKLDAPNRGRAASIAEENGWL